MEHNKEKCVKQKGELSLNGECVYARVQKNIKIYRKVGAEPEAGKLVRKTSQQSEKQIMVISGKYW